MDPGRQYKASLDEQREALKKLAEEFRGHKENAETELQKLKQEMAVRDTTIVSLNRNVTEQRLNGEAKLRLGLVALGFALSEAIVLYAFYKYGEGSNLLQRFVKALPLLAAFAPIWIAVSWFYVGKDRLRTLGWPFTKILRTGVEPPEDVG